MNILSNLANTHRPRKKVQRVGRGTASNRGKTCSRGNKGDKARQGYKQRYGEEGGQKPLYRKLPIRGFDHEKFRKETFAVTFNLINTLFKDGEVVSRETLLNKGILKKSFPGTIKVIATGKLTKKVSIEAGGYSQEARRHLEEQSVSFKVV